MTHTHPVVDTMIPLCSLLLKHASLVEHATLQVKLQTMEWMENVSTEVESIPMVMDAHGMTTIHGVVEDTTPLFSLLLSSVAHAVEVPEKLEILQEKHQILVMVNAKMT